MLCNFSTSSKLFKLLLRPSSASGRALHREKLAELRTWKAEEEYWEVVQEHEEEDESSGVCVCENDASRRLVTDRRTEADRQRFCFGGQNRQVVWPRPVLRSYCGQRRPRHSLTVTAALSKFSAIVGECLGLEVSAEEKLAYIWRNLAKN